MGQKDLQGLGKRSDAFSCLPEVFVIRGLHDRNDPLRDPRLDLPVPPELIELIREKGFVGSTILCRRNGKHEKGPYKGQWILEVVDGRKRVLATLIVNQERIAKGLEPYVIKFHVGTYSDAEVLDMMSVLNSGRTINDPITVAKSAKRRIDQFGATERDVALSNGISTRILNQYLSLLDLEPAVQSKVTSQELSFEAALELVNLPRERQVEEMTRMLTRGTAVGKEAVKEAKKATEATRPPPKAKGEPPPRAISGKKLASFSEVLSKAKPKNKSSAAALSFVELTLQFARREIDEETFRTKLMEAGIDVPDGTEDNDSSDDE